MINRVRIRSIKGNNDPFLVTIMTLLLSSGTELFQISYKSRVKGILRVMFSILLKVFSGSLICQN